jgi:hypothetical protein
MVLARRGIRPDSQAKIGYELGLTLPPEKGLKRLFPGARFSAKPLSYGYGTRVGNPKYSINSYFRRHKLPFKETYLAPAKIHGLRETVSENLSQGNDLMVCFNNKKLYGIGDWGHVCVIVGITKSGIRLLDPDNKPYKITVKASRLMQAIRYHGKKNRGGLWIISKIKK